MGFGLFMLLIILLAGGALLCACAAGLMAWSLVHPPRMTDGKAMWVLRRLSPADLGMGFEDVKIAIRDEHGKSLSISAWWIANPAAQGRCAVLVHGYADAKVGAIAWAPLWYSLGFNLLVPDMRAHGESGGTMCTAGYFERHDLSQIINEFQTTRPADTRQIVLFGLSMGAAVVAAAAALRTDLAAVVLDSPYAHFRHAAMRHMQWVGLPGRWLQTLAIGLAEWITGADVDAVAPVNQIAAIKCPVMVIEAGNDWSLSTEDRARLKEAVEKPRGHKAEMWTVDGADHLMAMVADPNQYREKLAAFLAEALQVAAADRLVQS
ncbi:MAG TPA: alpha/beta hydrolase [Tepidisphaeraceae bacterium]